MQIIGNLVKRDIQSRPNLPKDEFTFLQTFDVGEIFIRGVIERRQLKSIGLHGEWADADEALKLPFTIDRMNELREIIAEYPRSQVYNRDESGLYFRCLPKWTYLYSSSNRGHDGAIEHWVNLDDNPLVQEAKVRDSLVDNEDADEVRLKCYNHYYTLKWLIFNNTAGLNYGSQ